MNSQAHFANTFRANFIFFISNRKIKQINKISIFNPLLSTKLLSGIKMNLTIRPIQKSDDPVLARIVRDTLAEFGANHPGTVYFDPSTDYLSVVFQNNRSKYNVVELDGVIAGGGGIFPTEGLPEDTCELVKMYLLPHARGIGLGRMMIEKCISQAKELGYQQIYLESMPELKQALKTYAHFGFEYLKGPMGNSGHTGCSLWMIKKL